MRTAIIGTGGVGGYFGGKIAVSGNEVTFLARGNHLEALKECGLSVRSYLGDFSVKEVNATDKIDDIESPDLVIIALKAWQVKEIALELNKVIHSDTIILPLQNGILAMDELSAHISPENIIGGLCRIQSKIDSPGRIDHFGIDPLIIFGERDNSVSPRLQKLKEFFSDCDINSRITDDIQSELWKKFIGICVSGLLAVCNSTYGEIREVPETRKLMSEVMSEVYNLSQKAGVSIHSDFVARAVSYIDTFPYDSTSSLTRDILEGKPSELEYQNGTVVRLAEKYNINVPVNRFIYYCLLPAEMRSRGLI